LFNCSFIQWKTEIQIIDSSEKNGNQTTETEEKFNLPFKDEAENETNDYQTKKKKLNQE
jgi:AAA15 family ATPase/GTPase